MADSLEAQTHESGFSTTSQAEFGALTEPFRRELRTHCYRMMGTIQEAEDMVQEALLRAWQRRSTLESPVKLRAWLYKIATNVCLDALRQRRRRVVPLTRQDRSTLAEPIPADVNEPIWLEPYPDDYLPDLTNSPEAAFLARERVALAFVTAIHLLPPRQRAILILRDVLNWEAQEVGDFLGISVAAVKSALHRARTTLASHNRTANLVTHGVNATDIAVQSQLDAYVTAWQTADIESFLQLLKEDATFSMPPIPAWYQGRQTIKELVLKTVFSGQAHSRWHLLSTHANGQPAFGLYRRTEQPTIYVAYGIQVLTFRDSQIADVITFRGQHLFPPFKLALSVEFDPH